MSITGHDVFVVWIWSVLVYLMYIPPLWVVMRFLPPSRQLTKHYFKRPHFTSAELFMFRHFPGSLIRTVIFMGLSIKPRKGKRRQMTDIGLHVPNWYVVASKIFLSLCLGHGALSFLVMLGLWIGTFFNS